MQKTVIYRYLGTNGIIETPVHLEDTYYIRLFQLTADEGKVLSNGSRSGKVVTVPETEAEDWEEIPEGQE